MKSIKNKGFTLIELLVVIAIIAVLATVVILSLNPAELLRQARDSNRVSDMATLKSAVALYLADVASPSLAGSYTTVYTTFATTTTPASSTWGVSAAYTTSSASSSRGVSGTDGWLPVNFSAISSGAPIGNLPADPTNNNVLFYGYVATSSNLSFKLTTHLESTKYTASSTGPGWSDGGLATSTYEQGTNMAL